MQSFLGTPYLYIRARRGDVIDKMIALKGMAIKQTKHKKQQTK